MFAYFINNDNGNRYIEQEVLVLVLHKGYSSKVILSQSYNNIDLKFEIS